MTVNLQSAQDRRGSLRFEVNAPLTVTIGKRQISGFTRDLSNRGVYFYLDLADNAQIDREIEFQVELPPEIALSSHCRIRCAGRVLRTDNPSKQLTGIAVEILHYSIERESAASD